MNMLMATAELVATGRWCVRVAGPLAIFDPNGCEVSLSGRKARAIIVYLVAHESRRIPRERLMALLWGDRGQLQARNSLRQSLAEIRRACENLLSAEREQVWIDAAILEKNSATFVGGQFAEDLNHITPEFDDWLTSERQHQAAEAWKSLQDEVEELLAAGSGRDALALIERMQLIDPYNEDWLRLTMRAEAQAGHPAAIQKAFQQMADCLQRELGVAPAAATRELHDQLILELTKPHVHREKCDGDVVTLQNGACLAPAQPQGLDRKSPLSRRVVVGGALAGVAMAVAATPLWLRSDEPARAPGAMEYYRRGIELRGQASLIQSEQSVAYLREATRIDPDFGQAWGALAWGYRGLLEYGPRRDSERTAMLARMAASRALEIDPGDGQALAALLLLKPIYGNWKEIESGCRRLLKNDAAHNLVQYNLALTLCEVGRWRDALPILSDLGRREPFWPLVQMRIFCSFVSSGRLEEAEDVLDAAIKKWPRRADFWSIKIRNLLETGRTHEAVAFVNDPMKRPANADRWIEIETALLEAIANGSTAAKRLAATRLAGLATSAPNYAPIIAGALTLLGEVATAFEIFEGYYFARGFWRAARQDRPTTTALFVASTAALRRHPRFSLLLRETGLERYWAETATSPDYRRFP
jgi:DNA-binding SARP family transcriptional activator